MFNKPMTANTAKKRFFIVAYWHDRRWKKFVGATVKIWDLADNLSRCGHEVVLFLPRYHFDSGNSTRLEIVEVSFVDKAFIRYISFNFNLLLKLLGKALIKRPDVVYARRMNSIVPGLTAILLRTKFFYEVNDDPFRQNYKEGSRILFRLRSKISLIQDMINIIICNHAFVVTREIADKLIKKLPRLTGNDYTILPSGANTELFAPISKKLARSKLKIDPTTKIVGFVGTLATHQGIDTLIDAAASIIAKEPDTVFFIIGEGPMKRKWQQRTLRESLRKHFRFLGQVDYSELPLRINAMDVCVAPFLRIAGTRSPVKIFDYLACGRPVVASRINGTTDVFKQSGGVHLVEPEHPQRLAAAIVGILQNEQNGDRMGSEGRDFIVSNYDRVKIANTVAALSA
jgi:glycosyltransferase involved in cell wall biosynthesis